jgi:hypothetical protein
MDTQSEIIEEMLKRHPLIQFSLYTDSQAQILLDLGEKIIRLLDEGLIKPNIVDRPAREAYGQFWLWVLGAWEVIRTMDEPEHRDCFAEPIFTEIGKMKKTLHRIRIPFAKQELAGRKGKHVYSELSMYTFDHERKDIGYKIDHEIVWMRRTLIDFDHFIRSIQTSHVLKALPVGTRNG